MSAASKTFDEALRDIVCPRLKDRGFVFDGSRTFRRRPEGSHAVQIVNFQLGQRSLQGSFAVNLGVFVQGELPNYDPGFNPGRPLEYHCAIDRRSRLGLLIPSRFPALSRMPFLGALLRPHDVWWKFSVNADRTRASLATSLRLLEQYGFAWLDAHTPRDF